MKKIVSICILFLMCIFNYTIAQENKLVTSTANSFYYEPNEEGIIAPNKNGEIVKTKFKFTYTQIPNGKYVIILSNPVPKDDLYTTQIFLNVLTTLYKQPLPKGRIIDLIDFVPLSLAKNQTPKPCCKQLIRIKINNDNYYISNIAAQNEKNDTVAAFMIWKE